MSSRDRALLCAVVAVCVIGAILVSDAKGIVATQWMSIFLPSDFVTWDELLRYLRELRTAIPPAISTLEPASHQLTGSARPVTVGLYRVALVGSYVLAIVLAARGRRRVRASFVLPVLLLLVWAALRDRRRRIAFLGPVAASLGRLAPAPGDGARPALLVESQRLQSLSHLGARVPG